jgi:hypothetical protein
LQAVSTESTFTLTVENGGKPALISGCFNFEGCPVFESFNVWGYVGDGSGAVVISDFNATDNLLGVISIPDLNGTVDLDITAFVVGLIGNSDPYAGILLDATGDGNGFLAASIDITTVPLPAVRRRKAVV